jgi:putative flippase GtrA
MLIKRLHILVKDTILKILDFVYPPFKSIMPLKTFRYAACGGGTTALNIFIFFISYNFILKKQILHLPFIAISAHIAAFIIAFCITQPIGFYLNRYVVFKGSQLRRRVQLFRYFLVVLSGVFLNYLFLKLFVEQFGWYPTPSVIVITLIVIAFSYFSQTYFSFRTKKTDN